MRLPETLQAAIDEVVQKTPPSSLRSARAALSQEYREGSSSRSIFSDDAKRMAYLAARLPATYASAHRVFREICDRLPNLFCKTILDLGAGPGTASWAASEVWPEMEKTILIERSLDAIGLGKALMRTFPGINEWMHQDLEMIQTFPAADLAVLSYSLGELERPETLIDRLWQGSFSHLVVIEPGTPKGYQTILRARDRLLKSGAQLIAPCPHTLACPLKSNDWCHFSIRVERTKLHRLLKEGTLSYEDEKFSYLVVSRTSAPSFSRILRHPHKGSGHVRLSLCAPSGQTEERIVSRKEKEKYRNARDAKWGDSLNF